MFDWATAGAEVVDAPADPVADAEVDVVDAVWSSLS